MKTLTINKNIRIAFLLLFYFYSINTKAQISAEYLVTVDVNNGTFTKIDSIPGVKWITVAPMYTTFDSNNGRYIFRGGDDFGNDYLYSIDVITGNILSNPAFPVTDSADNVIELQYDNATNTLYALHWDNSESTEYLVTVDVNNGTFTKIDSIPGVKWITTIPMYTTFDSNNGRYIFRGGDDFGNRYLYSIDVNTGNILSNPAFPITDSSDNIIELQYDNATNTLYALHWDNSESTEYLVTVDINSGTFTKIDSIPGVKWITTMPMYTTFDSNNGRYIFRGGDDFGNRYLYSIDVNTGNILSNPAFPILSDPSDNVIELQYDNSTNTLYALHWDNQVITGNFYFEDERAFIKVYPNPFIYSSTIEFDIINNKNLILILYNKIGQVARTIDNIALGNVKLERKNLNSGLYFFQLLSDSKVVGSGKLIIE